MMNKIFKVMGRKNNQTSVSGVDREIPNLRDNAENLINLVSGNTRLSSGWDF